MPSACQNVMVRAPNTTGPSQFHRLITMNPRTVAATIALAAIFRPRITHLVFISFALSFIHEFVIDGLQTSAQVKSRVTLPREKSVYAQPRLIRKLFETMAVHLMRDENLTLFFGKFLQCGVQFLQKHAPRVHTIRPAVRGRKQVF